MTRPAKSDLTRHPRPFDSDKGEGGPSNPGPRRYAPGFPWGRDPQSVRQRIEAMEHILERSFVIPGTNQSIGLDSIVGLVPVAGDVVTAAMGAWMILEARNLGLSRWKLVRMAGNVAFDTAIGAVPVAGDVFDFLFKSNTRNLRIVKDHLDRHHPETRVIEQ